MPDQKPAPTAEPRFPEIPRGASHAFTNDQTCGATGGSGDKEARGNESFREVSVEKKPAAHVPLIRENWTVQFAVSRGHALAASIVFVASLLTYTFTLAPTVTGEDSGELIAAAYVLGIPHPPGYPLWCLLTWLFIHVPIGDVAYRANMGSAITSAAASALMVPLMARLGVRALVACGASLIMAFSSTLWGQSVIAEVYALSFLTTVMLLYCLVAWRQARDGAAPGDPSGDGWMMGGAFLTGTSLGAHHTILLLSPLVLAYVAWVGRGRLLRPAALARIVLGLVAGLSVYIYLPLRAAADPPINWGHPDNWERFWAHVTRAQYPSLLHSKHTWEMTLGQIKALAGYCITQWPVSISIVVGIGSLAGLLSLFRRDRALGAWLSMWAVVMSAGFAVLLNFKLDYESIHVAEVFFIPAWFCMVLLFALGIEALSRVRGMGIVAGAATVVLATVALASNAAGATMRGNDVARRYGQDMLATLPRNAIFFTSADYEAFPVAYLQIVEGARPDVAALDEQRDMGRALTLAGLSPPSGGVVDDADVARLMKESRRPILSTRILAAVRGTAVQPVGLLYRTFSDEKSTEEAPALDAAAWKAYGDVRPDGPWRGDWSTASMLVAYDVARARSALVYQHDAKVALERVRSASDRLPRDAVLMNSLGALLARGGLSDALDYYRRAIALRPDYEEAHYNLVTALIGLGRWEEAQEAYARTGQMGVNLGDNGSRIEDALIRERASRPRLQLLKDAVANNPADATAWMRLGGMEAQFNHLPEAEQSFLKAAEVAPQLSVAWHGLGMVRARRGNSAGAIEAWKKAIEIEPGGQQADSIRANMRVLGGKPAGR